MGKDPCPIASAGPELSDFAQREDFPWQIFKRQPAQHPAWHERLAHSRTSNAQHSHDRMEYLEWDRLSTFSRFASGSTNCSAQSRAIWARSKNLELHSAPNRIPTHTTPK